MGLKKGNEELRLQYSTIGQLSYCCEVSFELAPYFTSFFFRISLFFAPQFLHLNFHRVSPLNLSIFKVKWNKRRAMKKALNLKSREGVPQISALLNCRLRFCFRSLFDTIWPFFLACVDFDTMMFVFLACVDFYDMVLTMADITQSGQGTSCGSDTDGTITGGFKDATATVLNAVGTILSFFERKIKIYQNVSTCIKKNS